MTDETEKNDPEAGLKAELIVKAERLGVKVDKRWSAAKIEQAMGDHVINGPDAPGAIPEGHVEVRITKKGAGQVHDGEGGTYPWEALVWLPRDVAQQLEDNAYAEIRE